MKYSAAIDLGGTNIGIGIVSEEGELVFKTSVPVEDNKNPEALLAQMAEGTKQCIENCGIEKEMRIIADPNKNLFNPMPENCEKLYPVTLWQYEIDHSLIDCGMCIIVRCCDGIFFVIDSAHMYSVIDDERIVAFLTKINGGRKPVVAGWFFSHAHEDHVCKFLDIVDYRRSEIDIEAVYYNFPSAENEHNIYWGECGLAVMNRFEETMRRNPDIKCINLHSGQRFYVRNLEFV